MQGEGSSFIAALEDAHRPEDAYASRIFRPPPMWRALEGELFQLLCEWAERPEAAEGLIGYRVLTLLSPLLATQRGTPQDVLYFADEQLLANRLFEAKNFLGDEGPAGRTVVGFDLPCGIGTPAGGHHRTISRSGCARCWSGRGWAGVEVLGARVRRMAAAIPCTARASRWRESGR